MLLFYQIDKHIMKNPIVHFEIPADDVERAQEFYSTVFGWEIEKFDMPPNGSTQGEPYYAVRTAEVDDQNMIKKPGAINGGLMKRSAPGQILTNYVSVESIDAMLEVISSHGGVIVMPKTEIAPGMGWIALFKDTENNIMGLHEEPQKS